MKFTHIAVAAALLMTGQAATAQSATDAGCIIVSNAYMKAAKEAQAQKLAEASLYFYLGRIKDGTTAAQLKALFDAQAKTINDTTAPNMMNACLKGLQAKAELAQSASPAPPPQAAQPQKQPTTPPKR